MHNLQHASRFNAWLMQQCSQWTNTMLPALRANDCPEHECVYAFFAHAHKMFNMPNLYRLSLEQLKGAKQTELVAGASYVLEFMQAHVVTICSVPWLFSVSVFKRGDWRAQAPVLAGGGRRRRFRASRAIVPRWRRHPRRRRVRRRFPSSRVPPGPFCCWAVWCMEAARRANSRPQRAGTSFFFGQFSL